jgi:hypothetical protein
LDIDDGMALPISLLLGRAAMWPAEKQPVYGRTMRQGKYWMPEVPVACEARNAKKGADEMKMHPA